MHCADQGLMCCDSFRHHRHSIRMKSYDYASEGAYFVTVCTQHRERLLGDVVNGEIELNDVGKMVLKWWNKLPSKFSNTKNDQFVVMPNHIHGIIWIVGADPCVCPKNGHHEGAHTGAPLHRMVQWLKTMTSNEYFLGVKQERWPYVPKKLWQRNYYERIIRNDRELVQTQQYILDNPQNWELDPEY